MDIFAHGLWAGAFAKLFNLKFKKKINFWWTAFWGMFPDLFAFTIPFVFMIWNLICGKNGIPDPNAIEPVSQAIPLSNLAHNLYNISHSLIIFGIVFLILFLIFRKPLWVMFGWLLHILIDIPSHTYAFYPTPLFWPISDLKFSGVSWANPIFLIVNYAMLIIVYSIIFYETRKLKNNKKEKRK